MVATASNEEIRRFSVRGGEVVITKDSESADDIGIAAFVPESLPGVVYGYHLSVLRPRANSYGGFIKWLFDSNDIKAQLATRANGLTRVGLGQGALTSIPVPIPPVDEQRQIAAYLDRETGQIDELIAKQEQLLTTLAERRRAVIVSAVAKGASDWGVHRLGRLVTSRRSGTSVNAVDEPTVDGVGVLKTSAVSAGAFVPGANKAVVDAEERQRLTAPVEAHAVLVNRANSPGLVGSGVFVPKAHRNLFLSDKIWSLTFRAEHRFIAWWMQSPLYRDQVAFTTVGASSSMQNLSYADFSAFRISLPDQHEQRSIADQLDEETAAIDSLSTKATQMIALLRERRQALISALLTGEIDVRSA